MTERKNPNRDKIYNSRAEKEKRKLREGSEATVDYSLQ